MAVSDEMVINTVTSLAIRATDKIPTIWITAY